VNEEPQSAGRAAVAEQVSSEAATTSLLDGERIASLRRVANNDMNFLNQYCDAAFNDLELALTELRRALQSDDIELARDALHKIDGTAASLGAVALMEGSRQMRNYLSNGLDAEAAAAHAKLVTVCALTKSPVAADLRSELRGSDRSR
jgi:HPt (histidine-containing phosphotransfer) domain-containing protein